MTNSQILILGPAASSYVRTARMTCIEKALPHTLEPFELGGDAHTKLHPWKRVPILRHGELTLIETSAIIRYLDEIGTGASLLPATASDRARMEQTISVINCYLYDSLVRKYALQYVLPMQRGAQPDLDAIRANVPTMERDVGFLDAAYAKSRWIAGETLSLADLLVAPIVQTVCMFPEGKAVLARSRHLSRAFDELRVRDSFTKVHAGLFGAGS